MFNNYLTLKKSNWKSLEDTSIDYFVIFRRFDFFSNQYVFFLTGHVLVHALWRQHSLCLHAVLFHQFIGLAVDCTLLDQGSRVADSFFFFFLLVLAEEAIFVFEKCFES